MAPKVYIETTIPSYLTARPSRDLIIAGHQQITQEWWETRRTDFDIFVSQFVIQECAAGDPKMAQKRLQVLAGIPILGIPSAVSLLSKQLIFNGPLPERAETDAIHISIAAANGMDYLLTWNCKHIANASMERAIGNICRGAGFEPPVICTPEALMET